MASSKWRGGPICASPGSLPACAQKRSSWMQCSAGIASSARRCENICAAGNSSRQHASSQVDSASYSCKLARKLPARLEATDEGRINYQNIVLPSGEQPMGDPPEAIRNIALPPKKKVDRSL